jgi:FkbM family methyltransferase
VFYDFVEIGTSDFDIGDVNLSGDICFLPNKRYLLVDPVNYYLQQLQLMGYTGSNIIYCNSAISNYNGNITIWYINELKQKQYNLPFWTRGCNKVNEKHPIVVALLKQMGIYDNIWTSEKISCMTFCDLCSRYSISHIENLKIDTEGHDHIVLSGVIQALRDRLVNIEKIKFEYHPHPEIGNTEELDRLRLSIRDLYPVQIPVGNDPIDFYLSKQ